MIKILILNLAQRPFPKKKRIALSLLVSCWKHRRDDLMSPITPSTPLCFISVEAELLLPLHFPPPWRQMGGLHLPSSCTSAGSVRIRQDFRAPLQTNVFIEGESLAPLDCRRSQRSERVAKNERKASHVFLCKYEEVDSSADVRLGGSRDIVNKSIFVFCEDLCEYMYITVKVLSTGMIV